MNKTNAPSTPQELTAKLASLTEKLQTVDAELLPLIRQYQTAYDYARAAVMKEEHDMVLPYILIAFQLSIEHGLAPYGKYGIPLAPCHHSISMQEVTLTWKIEKSDTVFNYDEAGSLVPNPDKYFVNSFSWEELFNEQNRMSAQKAGY